MDLKIPRLPGSIWALGFVSMFMDISSEMIHGLLPVFITASLGASVAWVGIIDGVAEATAAFAKVFSGWWSDKLGSRKSLTLLGYGLSALTKPIFPLAVSPLAILGARFVDRVGKGVRNSPRDALIADLVPKEITGAAYGVRQALDTVGAFVGPALAILLMVLLAGDMRKVFAFSIIPAVIAVIILAVWVKEPARREAAKDKTKAPLKLSAVGRLGRPVWIITGVGALFYLASFSDAFLVLRGVQAGLPPLWAPLVYIVMNLVYAATAGPVGALSDRIGRHGLLTIGMGTMILADAVFAFRSDLLGVLVGAGIWGLHYGFSEGLFSALIADHAPEDLRGTAFGVYYFVTGLALLIASLVAGGAWAAYGPTATFIIGGGFGVAALIALQFTPRERSPAIPHG
jgi:MFS family permease